jgi:hypothetical protein
MMIAFRGFLLLSTPALASHIRRDKRFHPVQQEKQAKVTLEPEESVGGLA